jgi:hypothetical protein
LFRENWDNVSGENHKTVRNRKRISPPTPTAMAVGVHEARRYDIAFNIDDFYTRGEVLERRIRLRDGLNAVSFN